MKELIMRIKTYNKRKSKNNLIKFQTSSKILKYSFKNIKYFNQIKYNKPRARDIYNIIYNI